MQNFIKKNPHIKFQIQLEDNFKLMHSKWFYRKCDLCHLFPQTTSSELCLCLICNMCLCSISCQNEKKSNRNLFTHAQKAHAGFTVFLVVQDSSLIYIERGKGIWIQSQLYFNNFNEGFINRNKINWDDYKLSSQ